MMRLFLAVLVSTLVAFGPTRAQDAPDEAAIRSVIQAQLDAFKAEDGEAAFSYAAPRVRSIFGSPELFMGMVEQSYGAVYSSRSVVFGALRASGGAVLQQAFITGADGASFTALYQMEEQADGSWKIAGCMLAASGTAI